MTTCPECSRRRAYMAADPEMYRGDDTRCDAHRRAPTLSAELQELRTLVHEVNAMLRRVRSYRGYVGGPLCELWTLDVMRRLRDAAGEKP